MSSRGRVSVNREEGERGGGGDLTRCLMIARKVVSFQISIGTLIVVIHASLARGGGEPVHYNFREPLREQLRFPLK